MRVRMRVRERERVRVRMRMRMCMRVFECASSALVWRAYDNVDLYSHSRFDSSRQVSKGFLIRPPNTKQESPRDAFWAPTWASTKRMQGEGALIALHGKERAKHEIQRTCSSAAMRLRVLRMETHARRQILTRRD